MVYSKEFVVSVSVQTHGEQWSGIRIVIDVRRIRKFKHSPCSRSQHLLYDHTHRTIYMVFTEQTSERQEPCIVSAHWRAHIFWQPFIASLQFKGANSDRCGNTSQVAHSDHNAISLCIFSGLVVPKFDISKLSKVVAVA
ncbi:hypothetical protein AVEN_29264-1 [Araneus ventricosus]|uniref:Uncharacterized protein n=1 Tax=Araneus ventricosus TaxID=182803 RepID=A0A4Y2ISC2_ARAVE|nr:hypothetical protein AVEN_29264-1 [Araneus ventricosus]